MEMKALTGTTFNGVPVISNRSYTGSLSVADGQTAIIAGTLDRSETITLSGLPGLARIPIVNRALAHYAPQNTEGELLVMITPHIVRKPASASTVIPVGAVD